MRQYRVTPTGLDVDVANGLAPVINPGVASGCQPSRNDRSCYHRPARCVKVTYTPPIRHREKRKKLVNENLHQRGERRMARRFLTGAYLLLRVSPNSRLASHTPWSIKHVGSRRASKIKQPAANKSPIVMTTTASANTTIVLFTASTGHLDTALRWPGQLYMR